MKHKIGRCEYERSSGKYKCAYDYLHPHSYLLLVGRGNSYGSMHASECLDDFFCQGNLSVSNYFNRVCDPMAEVRSNFFTDFEMSA